MAMNSVLTNTAASSAQRFLSIASDKSASSISKMSSGSRIVKASDDASSLAISNKLRADIAALTQASRNASQGSSILQVASGGLSQIGDLLTRMKTLATQVVNGTLSSAERQFAQAEFAQLITQVDDTATQTQVNGIAMLAGGDKSLEELESVTNAGAAVTSGAASLKSGATAPGTYYDAATITNTVTGITGTVEGVVKDVRVSDYGSAGSEQVKVEIEIGNETFVGFVSEGAASGTATLMVGQNNDHNSFLLINNNAAYGTGAGFDGTLQTTLLDLFNLDGAGLVPASFKSAAQTAALTYAEINSSAAALTDAIDTSGATKNGIYTLTSSYRSAAQTGTVEDVTLRLQHEDGTVYEAVIKDEDTANANDILGTTTKTVKFSNGVEVTFSATELNNLASATQTAWLGGADGNAVRFEVKAGSATSLDFQIGAKSDDLITIDFDSMTGTELGVSGLNIETASNAQAASDSLDTAINKVNSATAEIGALQSRMEYVSSNLATITENLEAANGVFRDVDMAKEMTEFTKNQSLMQAGISMLSQANQMPQLLLRLIQ